MEIAAGEKGRCEQLPALPEPMALSGSTTGAQVNPEYESTPQCSCKEAWEHWVSLHGSSALHLLGDGVLPMLRISCKLQHRNAHFGDGGFFFLAVNTSEVCDGPGGCGRCFADGILTDVDDGAEGECCSRWHTAHPGRTAAALCDVCCFPAVCQVEAGCPSSTLTDNSKGCQVP